MNQAGASAASGRLLFISNLFPDQAAPYRGLDNATVLHQLSDRWQIRTIALRPSLPCSRAAYRPRPGDEVLQPTFLRVPYVPKIGSRVNHLLMAASLRTSMTRLRQEFPFDVVLSSWIYPDSCAVARVSRNLGFPFVSVAQGSDVHQYLQMPVRRAVIRKYMPAASSIISRSKELARLLNKAGIGKELSHPIYNGVDREVFNPGTRSEARDTLGIPQTAQVILFVGNFYPVKRPLTLIEAFAKLVAHSIKVEVRLLLVGGGPLESAMRERAHRLGVANQIIFAGRQDPRGVALRMQAADLLCLPSENEGVPNVILEAFSCGLRVVASDVGGIPEVLDRPELGRRVPPGDADALIDGLRDTLSAPPDTGAILRHASHFTWKRAADAYHKLLLAAARPSEQ